jgi:hypothetical protein
MDVMQVIGLDLDNLSKMIVWNGNQMPFKPHDYFDDAGLHESLASAMDEFPFHSIGEFPPMEILLSWGTSHRPFTVPYMNKWMCMMLLLTKHI